MPGFKTKTRVRRVKGISRTNTRHAKRVKAAWKKKHPYKLFPGKQPPYDTGPSHYFVRGRWIPNTDTRI